MTMSSKLLIVYENAEGILIQKGEARFSFLVNNKYNYPNYYLGVFL
jgi:hypothetical protein